MKTKIINNVDQLLKDYTKKLTEGLSGSIKEQFEDFPPFSVGWQGGYMRALQDVIIISELLSRAKLSGSERTDGFKQGMELFSKTMVDVLKERESTFKTAIKELMDSGKVNIMGVEIINL